MWVYRRGESFRKWGRPPLNPQRLSPKAATAEVDLYACRFEDGVVDYETAEDLLAAQESQAAPLLRRFEAGEELAQEERFSLALFLVQMIKRGTAHELVDKVVWAGAARSFPDREAVEAVCDAEGIPFSEEILSELAKLPPPSPERYPDNLRLSSLVMGFTRTAESISRMAWYLGIARGSDFVTGDNPVYFPESLGLGNPSSELYLPLTPAKCLIASHRRPNFGNRVLFLDAPSVRVINRRIASSSRQIIANEASPAILELFADSDS